MASYVEPMPSRPSSLLVLSATTLLVLAACGTSSEDAASPAASAGPATADAAVACVGVPEDAAVASWDQAAEDEAAINPIIVSSVASVGPSRVLFSLTDDNHRVINSPDISVTAEFFALGRDPERPAATAEASHIDLLGDRGLYRTTVDLDCAGTWGIRLAASFPDGSSATAMERIPVRAEGPTPAIGAPAPRSDSLTAVTPEEVADVSTDPDPLPGSFERTVAEVVTSGQPSLVFFATPAFCSTGSCGPTMNVVKSVVADYADEVSYVNVEPYELQQTVNGLQPVLDGDGRLVPVQAVLDYGIPVEPYLFLVDGDGNVFAKFEGVIGADELRLALEDVLS